MVRSVILGVLVCILSVAHAVSDTVLRAERPDWVIGHTLAEPNAARLNLLENGRYYLLHDRQVRWDGEEEVFFNRIAYRITERAGLEKGSSISREFDPSFQKLTLHSARILRGDQVIDLTDRLEFTVIRRETELDSGILDGDLTAHVYLPAVQVNDVVDLEFSWTMTPHIGRGQFSAAFTPDYSVPVGASHYRVVWPSGREMFVRASGTAIEPVRLEGDAWSEYRWQQFDPDPVASEKSVPDWHFGWGRVHVSSLNSWADVVEDLLPHYPQDVALPATFRSALDEIANATQNEAIRMSRALRLVQDEIRYVGIEIGRGAFIARSPEVTWAKGYGDCKDKSVLLAAGLRYLGLDAVPALVHLKRGRALADVLPTVSVFNHMIVRVEIAGRVVWLDPTLSYQGGEGFGVVPAELGHALALRPGQAELEAMQDQDLSDPTSRTIETFMFGDEGEAVTLNVETIRTGRSADWMRQRLARESVRAIGRGYHEYYDRHYPGITQERALKISDDRDANIVKVTEAYSLPWDSFMRDDLNANFPMRGGELIDVLKTVSLATPRRNPLWQSYPLFMSHKVAFRNTPVAFNVPDVEPFRDRHFHFAQDAVNSDDRLVVTWTLKTLAAQVEHGDVAAYVDAVEAMEDDVTWFYDFSPPKTGKASGEATDTQKDGPRFKGLEQLVDWISRRNGQAAE